MMRYVQLPACLALVLATLAQAQNSSSVPKNPASDTAVLTTKPPPPPPEDPAAGSDTLPDRERPEGREEKPRRDDRQPSPARPSGTPVAPSGLAMPAAPAATPPDRIRELLVASVDVAEADAQRVWLAQQGVGVLRRRALVNLGWVLTVYRVPPGADLPTLLAAFTAQWPNASPEANERYLPLASSSRPSFFANALVGLPARGCARALRIAMLDGPVNLHIFEPHDRIRSVDIAEPSADPDYAHGTGIAALLLGTEEVAGLLPNAQLLAINVFAQRGRNAYTTTEWILRGLDRVLGERPPPAVVNLSFGGPPSQQLGRALQRVQRAMRVVAAAGNDGAARPIYPAAHPGVVAVTAVDARRARWTRANAGDFVALAAPGVDVWTIDGQGRGYYASGTSFAAIFVSAAIALAAPDQTALPTWLPLHAEDLGTPGRDRLFGFGLLRAAGLCPEEVS